MLKKANEVLCLRSVCRELVNGGMTAVEWLQKWLGYKERLSTDTAPSSVLPDLANTDCPDTRSTCRRTSIVTIEALQSSKITLPITKRHHRSAAHATEGQPCSI